MRGFAPLMRHFFTHKDFLPPPNEWAGTLFSPLQIIFCALVAIGIAVACVKCAKKSEAFQKRVFFILWLVMVISEPLIGLYDTFGGNRGAVPWNSILSLWPCSIFLYTAPFAIFGKGNVRFAACGYICTLGLVGGVVNFVYPATYLAHYSCLSMAGLRTIFYHGAMVFVAITMLLSGYHSYKGVTKWQHLLLPAVPTLLVSIPANIVNFTVPNADYMFFKMESFFFSPIGLSTPDWVTLIFVYAVYLIIHATPYLPSYLTYKKQKTTVSQI